MGTKILTSIDGLSSAAPIMLQNVFTSNVIAQTGEWPHNNGLCAYAGTTIGENMYWFFLQYASNSFKIANKMFNNYVVADAAVGMFAYDGGNYPDQYWAVETVDGEPNTVRFRNLMRNQYIFDPNPVGQTGALGASNVTPVHETRFDWTVIGQTAAGA